MYVHPRHRLDDAGAIHAMIEAHPLGAWVCHGGQGLVANHLPFLLDRSQGPLGTLIAHVARANPFWRQLGPDVESVVMFQGPQAYVTPGWYPGKRTHGRVVPTWNYAVAHAHGVARVVHTPQALRGLVERLTDHHEARQPEPWRVGDAPPDYIDHLLRAIVGIEIPIDRLQAKLKASQDEELEDRLGTVRGLRWLACPVADAMAARVERAIEADRQR